MLVPFYPFLLKDNIYTTIKIVKIRKAHPVIYNILTISFICCSEHKNKKTKTTWKINLKDLNLNFTEIKNWELNLKNNNHELQLAIEILMMLMAQLLVIKFNVKSHKLFTQPLWLSTALIMRSIHMGHSFSSDLTFAPKRFNLSWIAIAQKQEPFPLENEFKQYQLADWTNSKY